MNAADPNWRDRTRAALERHFRDKSWPRLILLLILTLVGVAGFAISVALLHLGLKKMWLRYPIVVGAGYAAFLLLLRGWVELEKKRFNPAIAEIKNAFEQTQSDGGVRAKRDHSSWLDCLDFPSDLAFDEGCLIALLVGVVLVLIGVLIFAIYSATSLIAEVFLDAFIVTVLYRRLRIAANEHWLGTAVRRTWLPALLTAASLSLAGWCLETATPDAHSIGPALRGLLTPRLTHRPSLSALKTHVPLEIAHTGIIARGAVDPP
jgi:hypothetical protein